MSAKPVSPSGNMLIYPDELPGAPLTGDLPPLAEEDIARTAERLQAGRANDAYTLGPSDLHVLMHLTQEQWQVVKRDPLALTHILTPTARA